MSGRGRASNRGRDGRGTNFHKENKMKKPEIKKSLIDYNYHVGSARQASDYEITTEFLINYIRKTYEYGDDIAIALEKLQHVKTDEWKPSMQVSLATEDVIREAENRQFEIEFKSDYDTYSKRKEVYTNNKTKSYALLWERCTKGMKNKIEAITDFEPRIKTDPIELLKSIRQHSLNYQEH